MSKNLPMFFNSQKFLIFLSLLIIPLASDFVSANDEEIGRHHDPREGLFERLGNRSASSLQLGEPWWHELYPDIDEFLKKVERCSSIEDIKNLEQEIADKIGFNLMTVTSQYGALLPRTVYFTSAPLHVELLKRGRPFVKTPKDFLRLIRHNMITSPAYRQGIDLFVHESMDIFFKTNPSVDDILELGNEVSFALVLDKVRDETMTFFIRLNDVEKRSYPIRIELIERGLPFVKSIEDYFKLIELTDGSFSKQTRQAYEEVILKSFDRFFSLNPSHADILELGHTCRFSPSIRYVLARRGIHFTRTVEGYFYLLRWIKPPFLRAETILKSLEHFLSLNPSFYYIQSLRKNVRDAGADIALRERGYPMAVTIWNHIVLSDVAPNVLESYNFHPKLKQRSDDLIRQNLDRLFALHPAPADIARLAHTIFHSEVRLEIFQKGFWVVKTIPERVDLIVKATRIATSEEEKQTLEFFVATRLDDIFALEPTADDVAKLREAFCHSPLGARLAERGLALATSVNDFLLLTEGHWHALSERDRVIAHSLDRFFEMNPSPHQLLQLTHTPLSPDILRRLVEWGLLEVTSADLFNNLVKKYNESPGKEKLGLDFVLKTIPLFFSKAHTIEEINAYISRAQIIVTYEAHEAIVERALRYIETPQEYEALDLPPEEKRSQKFRRILDHFEQTRLPYLAFQQMAMTHSKLLHEMTVFEKGKRVVLPNAVLKELHYDSSTHRIRGVMVVERSQERTESEKEPATASVAYEVFWNIKKKIYIGLCPAIDPKTQQPIDAEKYLEEWRNKRKAEEEERKQAAALQAAEPKPSLARRVTASLWNSWGSLVDSVSGLFLSREAEVRAPPPSDLLNSLSESSPGTEKITTREPRVPSVEQSLFESYDEVGQSKIATAEISPPNRALQWLREGVGVDVALKGLSENDQLNVLEAFTAEQEGRDNKARAEARLAEAHIDAVLNGTGTDGETARSTRTEEAGKAVEKTEEIPLTTDEEPDSRKVLLEGEGAPVTKRYRNDRGEVIVPFSSLIEKVVEGVRRNATRPLPGIDGRPTFAGSLTKFSLAVALKEAMKEALTGKDANFSHIFSDEQVVGYGAFSATAALGESLSARMGDGIASRTGLKAFSSKAPISPYRLGSYAFFMTLGMQADQIARMTLAGMKDHKDISVALSDALNIWWSQFEVEEAVLTTAGFLAAKPLISPFVRRVQSRWIEGLRYLQKSVRWGQRGLKVLGATGNLAFMVTEEAIVLLTIDILMEEYVAWKKEAELKEKVADIFKQLEAEVQSITKDNARESAGKMAALFEELRAVRIGVIHTEEGKVKDKYDAFQKALSELLDHKSGMFWKDTKAMLSALDVRDFSEYKACQAMHKENFGGRDYDGSQFERNYLCNHLAFLKIWARKLDNVKKCYAKYQLAYATSENRVNHKKTLTFDFLKDFDLFAIGSDVVLDIKHSNTRDIYQLEQSYYELALQKISKKSSGMEQEAGFFVIPAEQGDEMKAISDAINQVKEKSMAGEIIFETSHEQIKKEDVEAELERTDSIPLMLAEILKEDTFWIELGVGAKNGDDIFSTFNPTRIHIINDANCVLSEMLGISHDVTSLETRDERAWLSCDQFVQKPTPLDEHQRKETLGGFMDEYFSAYSTTSSL